MSGYTEFSRKLGATFLTTEVTDSERAVFDELNEASYSEPPAPQGMDDQTSEWLSYMNGANDGTSDD